MSALALGVITPALSPAQEPGAPAVSDSGVVFDFQEADIRVVVTALAQIAGLNIVYTDLPSTPVTLRTTRPIPPGEVRGLLESLADANDLRLVEDRGLIRLVWLESPERAPVGVAREPGTAGPTPATRLWVHRLRFARAEVIVATLRALYGLGGGMEDFVATSASRTLSQQLEDQLGAPYRELMPAPPPVEPVAVAGDSTPGQTEGLETGLEAPVEIVPDLISNAVLIRATPGDYRTLRAAIHELDTRPLQVLIEVLIAEVRRSKDFALGIDANIQGGTNPATEVSLAGRSAGDFVISVLGTGSVSAEVVIQALAASGDVTILSRPVVLAQNNHEARILIGDQRPFIQVFRALPTDAAVRDQVVQYRNVGTQLSIRPIINADGYVSLTVTQEVSTATAETQFGAPVINTREVQTELLLKDGHTAVLGGLIDQQTEKTNSGVPLLKDIPLLGYLFRSTQERSVSNELFILLTPHVLDSDEEVDEMTRRLQGSTTEMKKRVTKPSLLTPTDSLQQL